MHFSLFLTSRSQSPAEDRRVIEASIAHAKKGAAQGFDAIFLPDHHFTGYMPASSDPFMLASYLAAQIPDIWLGFSVQTVPLHHPVRFAERVALLSQLNDGRILVGVGSGTTPEESIGFGVNFQDTSKVGQENLEIIQQLWAKQPDDAAVMFDTGHYKGAVVSRISPVPYGDPVTSLMTVAARPSSVERGAKLAQPAFVHNFDFTGVPRRPFEIYRDGYLRYREALEASGHSQEKIDHALEWTTATWQFIQVAETDEQAEAELDEQLTHYQEAIDRETVANKEAERISGVETRPTPHALSPEFKNLWALWGSPDTVAARLQEYADLGVGNILGGFMGGPLTDRRQQLTDSSLDLFTREVMPRFQAATR